MISGFLLAVGEIETQEENNALLLEQAGTHRNNKLL